MDWKEGAKWFIIIVGAGVAGELVMLLINKSVTLKAEAVAKETARAEVERVIEAAVAQLQNQQNIQVKTGAAPTPQVYISPQKEQAYSYQL